MPIAILLESFSLTTMAREAKQPELPAEVRVRAKYPRARIIFIEPDVARTV